MKTLTLNKVKDGFNLVEQFNRGEINPEQYFDAFKALTNLKFTVCLQCPEAIQKTHGDIQTNLWRALFDLKPEWRLDYTFSQYRLNTEHFKNQLSVFDVKLVQTNINKLNRERSLIAYGRSSMTLDNVDADLVKFKEILTIKIAPNAYIARMEQSESNLVDDAKSLLDDSMNKGDKIKALLKAGYDPEMIIELAECTTRYFNKLKLEHDENDSTTSI